MSQAASVYVEGDNRGRIALGTNITQVQAEAGATVIVVDFSKVPKPTPRESPIRRLPRPFSHLIDRRDELEFAMDALNSPISLEISGEFGIGKSCLMRSLAHLELLESF